MLRSLALLLTLLTASWLAHATQPSADALERTLAGQWQGALEYRDYQSNQRVQLPMQLTVQLAADSATFVRSARFDDGPATGAVTITSLFAAEGRQLTSASFRKGRAVELMTEDAQVLRYEGPQDWTVVYTRRGPDGGALADIRITQTRRGATLTTLKEVKRPDEPDSAYAFRNQTVLVRQP